MLETIWKKCLASIDVYDGLIVNGFKIQDEIFGNINNYHGAKRFDLNRTETVESIIYGRNGGTTAYRDLPCGLQIQTNLRESERFSWSNPCPQIYRVDIPPDTPLRIFFKENVKTRTMWQQNWFDGFISEYITETTSGYFILTLKRFLKYKQRKNNFKLILYFKLGIDDWKSTVRSQNKCSRTAKSWVWSWNQPIYCTFEFLNE